MSVRTGAQWGRSDGIASSGNVEAADLLVRHGRVVALDLADPAQGDLFGGVA